MPTIPDSQDLMRDLRKRVSLHENEAKRYRAALSALGDKSDGSKPSASRKRRSAATRRRMSEAQKARFARERQAA